MIEHQKKKRIKRIFKRVFTEPNYVLKQINPLFNYKLTWLLRKNPSGVSYNLSAVSFFLTWRCNLNCSFCNLWGDRGVCRGKGKEESFNFDEELKEEEIKKIIDEIAPYSPEIILTGGEPLVYKFWYEMAQYAKEKKVRAITLLTNGSLLFRFAPQIAEVIDSLNISIDGPEDLHNTIRGDKDLHNKIIEGIRKIQDEKRRKNKKTPYINIAFTISDLNYLYLEEFLKYWQKNIRDLGINIIIFQHLEFTTEDNIKKTEEIYKKEWGISLKIWPGFSYQPQNLDIDKLVEIIQRIKTCDYEDVYITFFPDFSPAELKNYYQYPDRFPRSPKACLGPWREALITPEGELWICPDYSVGNLKENKFSELWNNEKAKIFRKKLQRMGAFLPVCRCCGCFYLR